MPDVGEGPAGFTAMTAQGLLEARPRLLRSVIEHVRSEYPSYAMVGDDALAESFTQNIEMCLRALQESGVPSRQVLTRWADIARRRFEVDVPVDDLIRSYRFSIGLIADETADLVAAHDLSATHGLAAYRLLWEVSDAYIAILVEVYRQHQLKLDTNNHQAKVDLLERMRTGRFDAAAVFSARSRFGLDPERRYMPFIARWADGRSDVYPLIIALEPHLAGSRGLAVVEVDRISGICSDVLTTQEQITLAYGPPAVPAELAASFDTAQRVMATSVVAEPGNFHLDDAGWRAAVGTTGTDQHLWELYTHRFREPLEAAGADVEVMLESIRVHLEGNRSFATAAATLHCHPNTLRYRVSRFEEITGQSIESTETIVALQWFFEMLGRGDGPFVASNN